MRRPFAAPAVALALAFLGSCDRPSGIDGSLSDDWAALSPAAVPVPATQTCYRTAATHVWVLDQYAGTPTASCDGPHQLETFHVGAFTGVDAERTGPPPMGSPEARRAYATCASEATAFLGDDWRTGRLDISVRFPSAAQWSGQARYFRCDAVEVATPAGLIKERTGSLRGSLTGGRPLQLTCAT